MQERALPRPTLMQAVLPQTGLARNSLVVLGFCVFVALCAQIVVRLPFTTVPITGQTLGVLLTGAALGSRLGAVTLLLYLVAGSVGFPVYGGGGSGALWSMTSGGYLAGFVVAAWLVGLLAGRGWDRRPRGVLAMLLGNGVIYLFGLPWLAFFIASSTDLQSFIPGATLLEKTLNGGLWPFIPGDVIKLLLAAAVLPSAWTLVLRREESPPRRAGS